MRGVAARACVCVWHSGSMRVGAVHVCVHAWGEVWRQHACWCCACVCMHAWGEVWRSGDWGSQSVATGRHTTRQAVAVSCHSSNKQAVRLGTEGIGEGGHATARQLLRLLAATASPVLSSGAILLSACFPPDTCWLVGSLLSEVTAFVIKTRPKPNPIWLCYTDVEQSNIQTNTEIQC